MLTGIEDVFQRLRRLCKRGSENNKISLGRLYQTARLASAQCFSNVLQDKLLGMGYDCTPCTQVRHSSAYVVDSSICMRVTAKVGAFCDSAVCPQIELSTTYALECRTCMHGVQSYPRTS